MKIGKMKVGRSITEEAIAIIQKDWEDAEKRFPEKRFNHPDRELDTNPSRGMNITPHHSPLSTASACYSRD